MADKKGCVLSEVLRNQVQERFDRLKQTLDIREKILLRQIDVLVGHQAHMMIENIEFIADNEFDMLKRITSFGKFSIKHFQIKDDCMGVEEYIDKDQDHHEECKSIEHHPLGNHRHCVVGTTEPAKIPPKMCHGDLPLHNRHNVVGLPPPPPPQTIPPPSHHNQQSHHGAEQNIHITFNEDMLNDKSCIDLTTTTTTTTNNNTKEMSSARHKYVKICENAAVAAGCMGNGGGGVSGQGSIRKSKQNKQQHTISIATTTQTSTQTDPHHHPPTPASSHHAHHQHGSGPVGHKHPSIDSNNKILKNISNLTMTNANGTINLRNISNLTINNASACGRFKVDKEHIHHSSTENHTNSPSDPNPECGFYDRLITENKHLQYKLMQNAFGTKVCTPSIHADTTTTSHHVSGQQHADSCPNQNDEKTINNNDQQQQQPVQVQQWLKQIIYETETEPIINSEFMEYINIQR